MLQCRPAATRGCAGLRRHLSRRRRLCSTSAELVVERLDGDRDGVVVLSMNRPEAKNALGNELLGALADQVQALRFDGSARCVVLRSAVENVFCAGADLKERAAMAKEEVEPFVFKLRQTFSELSRLPMPTIAVVEGFALGGGLELAMSCDMRVLDCRARVGLPETGLAIIPGAGGTVRLPRLVGASRAKELIFTGRVVESEEAERIGIATAAVGEGRALEEALSMAERIRGKGPVALRLAKQAIDSGAEVDEATAMKIEQACYAQVIPTRDRLEGLRAFREKRAPRYEGA